MRQVLDTLRFRVAVWYAAILSVILAVFGGLVYAHMRYQLVRHHDVDLIEMARDVAAVLAESREPVLSESQRERLERLGHVIVRLKAGQSESVLHRTRHPSAVAAREEDEVLSMPVPESRTFSTISGDAGPLRMYAEAHVYPTGETAVIQVVQEVGDVSVSLQSLRWSFLLMAPLAVALSAAVGYWVAGRALAPVDRVTKAAREIEASSLGRRLPRPRGNDEIGRLVETFNQLIARLEASFQGMKRFTADAAHELRGPLATMRGSIDVALGKSREASELEAVLASVGDDVDRLRSIAEDLLVLARADAGRVVLERTPVRLDLVVSEVAESLEPAAAAAGLALRASCGAPVVVLGDDRWLRQLAFNLVDNAIKFSGGAGGVRKGMVSVEVRPTTGSALLEVADCGPGIPTDALGHVFERFYRADDARTASGSKGFGLGLAIAAWIVEAHGGTIDASNRPEGGSVFSVMLPVSAASAEDR